MKRAATVMTIVAAVVVGGGGAARATTLGQITEFPTPTAASTPEAIVAGPDGNLWFAEYAADKLAEINPATHAITEYPLPTPGAEPLGVAVGPDGKVWFTEFHADQIGELDPATGAIHEFPIPTAGSGPVALAPGSNGAIWFTQSTSSRIGEINPASGAITSVPTPTPSSGPFGITLGPDGNIWFTEKSAGKIAKLDQLTGTITEYAASPTSAPNAIAPGPDASLWFTEAGAAKVGEASPTGTITEISANVEAGPLVLTTGPDGNIWFTEGGMTAPAIGEIDPVTHQVLGTFATPTGASSPIGVAAGEDGNLWFTESGVSQIGVVGSGSAAALTTLPTVSGVATPGSTLTCTGASWATWNDLQPSLSANGFDGYAWLANGVPIGGATAQTYVPVAGNVGAAITCRVTVTYGLPNTTGVATSAPVTVGQPPASATPPTISGTAVAGKTLTESHGSWSGVPTTYGFQWELCNAAGASCVTIAGASGQTYTIPAADAGQSLRVIETTANQWGESAPASSAATAVAALPRAVLSRTARKGAAVAASVDCAGAAGQTCAGTYTVTTKEHVKGKAVVAVTAAAKAKTSVRTVTIAHGSFKISSARTTAVTIALNATGKKLLAGFYKVAATLKLTAAKTTTKAVTFSYGRISSPVAYTWAFGPSSSTIRALTVSKVPAGGVVLTICHGGGCPFGKRQFNARRGAASLSQAFSASHLSPGATLDVEISAPDDIAKVVEFTIVAGRAPEIRELCQPPGTTRPARCV